MQKDMYTPPSGPPQGPGPSREIYAAMGRENIFLMLEDFYLELEQSSIRPMFAEDMKEASKKSAAFFVQIFGGPPLFIQQYGPPRMRARHLPFRIDEAARQEWLKCFKKILSDAPTRYNFPSQHLPGFIHWLDTFSRWMVNTR